VIEVQGLTALISDLEAAPEKLRAGVRATVSKAALNIKNDAKDIVTAATPKGYARAYPFSITYDTEQTSTGGTSAEIGPDKDKRQGALGNLIEFGSANNAPIPHLGPALEHEIPNLEFWLTEIAGDAL
jgi:HK97 gp10 family phage protein